MVYGAADSWQEDKTWGFRVLVLSVLLYLCETWTLTSGLKTETLNEFSLYCHFAGTVGTDSRTIPNTWRDFLQRIPDITFCLVRIRGDGPCQGSRGGSQSVELDLIWCLRTHLRNDSPMLYQDGVVDDVLKSSRWTECSTYATYIFSIYVWQIPFVITILGIIITWNP